MELSSKEQSEWTWATTEAIKENPEGGQSTFNTEIFNIMAGVLGVVGNAFAILVILRYKKMRQRVGCGLIVNQCILDLLASLMLGVYHLRNVVAKDGFEAPYLGIAGDLYCKLWANGIWHWCMMNASTYNLVGITLERYLMVVHPIYHKTHMTRNRVIIMCSIPWLLALVHQVVWAIFPSGLDGETCLVYEMYPNSRWFSAFSIIDCSFSLVIPVGSMCCMYIRMIVALKSKVGPKPVGYGIAAQNSHNLGKAQRNLTKTCAIVVAVFICLWSPSQIFWVMYAFGVTVDLRSHLDFAILLLVNINGSVNPFIYIFSYQEFRRGVRNLFSYKITSSIDSTSGQGSGSHQQRNNTARY